MNKEYVFVGTAQLKTRDYIKQLEKENQELKKQQKEFIEYLTDYIDVLEQQVENIGGLDIAEEHILMVLEENLQKYKEIIGDDK